MKEDEKEKKKEDENKKEEKKEEENKKEEEAKKEEEEKKKEEENIKEEEKNIKEESKSKETNNINEKWNKYLNEFKDSVKKKRLTEDQEKDLILCIRFNYLSHSELVKLTNETIMNEYKDLLLKA